MKNSSAEAEMAGYKPRYVKNRSSHHLKNAVSFNKSRLERIIKEKGEFPLLNSENMSRSLDGKRMVPNFFHNINYEENQNRNRGSSSSVRSPKKRRSEQISTPTSTEFEDDNMNDSGSFRGKPESEAKSKDKQNQIFHSQVKALRGGLYPARINSSVVKSPTGSHPCEILDHNPAETHGYPLRYSYKPQNIPTHGDRREDIDETQNSEYSSSENSNHVRTNSLREHQDVRAGRNTDSRGSIEYQMPNWAKQILSTKLDLTCRFRNIRKSIEKWSFETPTPTQIAGDQPPNVFTVDGSSLTSTLSSSTDDYHSDDNKHCRKQKPDNMAVCVLGLFLIVVFVIPVIVIIYIYTDRSDYVSTELQMTFNGTLRLITNGDSVAYNICRQIDLSLSTFDSFHGCNINSYIGGITETDLTLYFRNRHFPSNSTITTVVNNHFSTLQSVDNYSYVNSSTIVTKYNFVNVLGTNIYVRHGI